MVTHLSLMTVDELAQLPDYERFELVKGEMVQMAPPGGEHGELALDLGSILRAYVRANDLGKAFVETGYILRRDPDTVRGPDISFLRKDRLPPEGTPRSFIDGPPDLAIEIVSPHDTVEEVDLKVEDYLQSGTRLVWVVQPKSRRVMVYRPDGSGRMLQAYETLTGEDVIPGFELPLTELWQ